MTPNVGPAAACEEIKPPGLLTELPACALVPHGTLALCPPVMIAVHVQSVPPASAIWRSQRTHDANILIGLQGHAEVGEPGAVLKGHEGPINYIPFHPHQPDLLLSCANDGTCRIWNVLDQSCSPVVLDVRQGLQQPPAQGRQLIYCYDHKCSAQSRVAPIASYYCCLICDCEPHLPRPQDGSQASLTGGASANALQHGAALGSALVACPEGL